MSRGSPRTPPCARRRRPRASRRTARAGRRAAPSASPGRRRRGSTGAGTGTRPRPANSARSGRISSLRASVRRRERTFGLTESGLSVVTAPVWNTLPSTAPRSITRTLLGVEPVQTRGEQEVDRGRDRHVREVLDRAPRPVLRSGGVRRRSTSRASPRRTAGSPRPPRGSGRARSLRDVRPPEEVVDEQRGLVARERLQQDRAWRSSCRRPSPRGCRAARAARGTGPAPRRRASSRRDARSGPASSAPPSGCRRRPRPRAARARGARGPCGRPRRRPPSHPEAPSRTGRRRAPRCARRRGCSARKASSFARAAAGGSPSRMSAA